MKKNTKILITILAAMILLLYGLGDAFWFAPKRIKLREEKLSSTLIPEQMDNIRILYFSDLDYGTFVNEERLSSLTDKINNAAADVILFGGDLYDAQASAGDDTNVLLEKYLSAMNAPLGKFAVYGDIDEESDAMKNAVNTIYSQSGFEVLNNTAITLHNRGSQSITLAGLDNTVNGKPQVEPTYSSISRDSYVITICHTPDAADLVPSDITNYFLAGHSHGGQAYYLLGSMYHPAGAEHYLRGTHQIDDKFTLDITNGVGTTGKDVRFLADQEIVVYTLHHEDDPDKTTPQPTKAADSSNDEENTEAAPTPDNQESAAPEESPAADQQQDTQAEQQQTEQTQEQPAEQQQPEQTQTEEQQTDQTQVQDQTQEQPAQQ